LDGDVERGHRLIEDEDPRIDGERPGDGEALPPAAGPLVGVGAVLLAPCTPTGNTNESPTELVVADVLVLALTALDETSAVEHAHRLNALRGQLPGAGELRQRRG
jgi:hypothetical protein